jgi:hypothetical protein
MLACGCPVVLQQRPRGQGGVKWDVGVLAVAWCLPGHAARSLHTSSHHRSHLSWTGKLWAARDRGTAAPCMGPTKQLFACTHDWRQGYPQLGTFGVGRCSADSSENGSGSGRRDTWRR